MKQDSQSDLELFNNGKLITTTHLTLQPQQVSNPSSKNVNNTNATTHDNINQIQPPNSTIRDKFDISES